MRRPSVLSGHPWCGCRSLSMLYTGNEYPKRFAKLDASRLRHSAGPSECRVVAKCHRAVARGSVLVCVCMRPSPSTGVMVAVPSQAPVPKIGVKIRRLVSSQSPHTAAAVAAATTCSPQRKTTPRHPLARRIPPWGGLTRRSDNPLPFPRDWKKVDAMRRDATQWLWRPRWRPALRPRRVLMSAGGGPGGGERRVVESSVNIDTDGTCNGSRWSLVASSVQLPPMAGYLRARAGRGRAVGSAAISPPVSRYAE